MATTAYPNPSFLYQGAALTMPAVRFGPMALCPAHSVGTNYAASTKVTIPDITVRPVDDVVHDMDPCTASFGVFYTQYRSDPLRGVAYPMVFRLTSDRSGGVIGVEAALEVDSNYPEIDMAIPRFPFTQPGFGILKEATLPGDYQATLTVRVWNGKADIALDGWLMLECGYRRDEAGGARTSGTRTSGSTDASALVAVGRTSLYPAPPNKERVVGGAYRELVGPDGSVHPPSVDAARRPNGGGH